MQAQQAVILVDRAATLRSVLSPRHTAAVAVAVATGLLQIVLAVAVVASVRRVVLHPPAVHMAQEAEVMAVRLRAQPLLVVAVVVAGVLLLLQLAVVYTPVMVVLVVAQVVV